MLRQKIPGVLRLLLLGFAISCSQGEDDVSSDKEVYTVQQPENPISRGDRLLGITPSESDQGFAASFAELQKVDVDIVELNLEWSYFEPEEGRYQDPQGLLQAISFYGEQGIQLGLSLATINTVRRTDPAYLQHKSFDDPEYLAAFNRLLDWVLAHKAENVALAYISVGNEVDIYLSPEEWPSYLTFAQGAIDHIHNIAPDVPVGAKVTVMDGLWGSDRDRVRELISLTDVAMLNYYPQDEAFRVLDPSVVVTHLDEIVSDIQQPIYFTEVGYQSGATHCQSSESRQAEFYHTLFQAWDQRRDRIRMININWLHDASPEQLSAWKEYYGSSADSFVEYLSTLGLRNHDHTDKPAWKQLQTDAQSRGW